MVKHTPTYATIVSLFLVAGCSSGGDGQPLIDEGSEETQPSIGESPDEITPPDIGPANPDTAGDIQFLGFISRFTESTDRGVPFERRVSVDAEFREFSKKYNPNALLTSIGFSNPACVVSHSGTKLTTHTLSIEGESVSAGEVITVMSSTGSLPDLVELPQDGSYVMDGGEVITQDWPEGVTVSVPGSIFPSFLELNMPDGHPIIGASVRFENNLVLETSQKPPRFYRGSEFGWRGGEHPGTFIKITFHTGAATGPNGDWATCLVPDKEWKWVFPEAIQELMNESYLDVQMSRVSFTTLVKDNAMVVLSTERKRTLY